MVTATRNKISPWKDLCHLFICQPFHIWFASKRIFFHLKGFKIREVEWLSLRTMGLFRTQSNIDDGPLCKINWLPTKLTAFAKKLHYGCSTGSYIGLWKQLNICSALNFSMNTFNLFFFAILPPCFSIFSIISPHSFWLPAGSSTSKKKSYFLYDSHTKVI